eukprot:NODE_50_length_27150_cov_0.307308.p14 type:complete len:154 gc:universal NODE_50_length_27150_cov_0.307308:1218-757(-)
MLLNSLMFSVPILNRNLATSERLSYIQSPEVSLNSPVAHHRGFLGPLYGKQCNNGNLKYCRAIQMAASQIEPKFLQKFQNLKTFRSTIAHTPDNDYFVPFFDLVISELENDLASYELPEDPELCVNPDFCRQIIEITRYLEEYKQDKKSEKKK